MPLTNWQTAITVLLTAGAILSTLRYGRARLPTSKKTALIILRTAWIIGLAISLLEPTLRFERFEQGGMRIPVLIDASASMRNFSPDAYINPFIDTLMSLQSRAGGHVKGGRPQAAPTTTGGRVVFDFYLFGDSTRAWQAAGGRLPPLQEHLPSSTTASSLISFNDTKSVFPGTLDERDGRFSGDMIIISDGHWSGSRRASEIFPRNTIHYLTLPDADPNPFITTSYKAPETSPTDSSFAVDISTSGYVKKNGLLTVTLKEKGRVIKTETTEIKQGYFSQSVQIRTKNTTPGRRLYTIEASVDSTVPPSATSFVHQTIPHFLTYSMYSAKPTLDRRYISQALISSEFFKAKPSSPDILFLFDWDTAASGLTRSLPRHGITVFTGALPCSSSSVAAPSITIKPADNTAIKANIDLRSMPPPQEIITCGQQPARGIKRILQATINAAGGRTDAVNTGANTADGAPNTPAILFSGRHQGRQSLFCPVRGIWRWDFWPMSSDRAESELFSFSNLILATAKELLLDNISDQLILYPSTTPVETDSVRFFMSLPATVPIFEPVKLSVQIKGAGANIGNNVNTDISTNISANNNANIDMDTAFNYTPQGLNRQPLSFRALPPGRYALSSSLDGGGIKAAFADSFTVNKDMSELSVLAQNTQYLQEFAQPIDFGDGGGFNELFDSWDRRSAEKHTVTETMRFRRSWLLLGIVLMILAVELVLRRVWDLD